MCSDCEVKHCYSIARKFMKSKPSLGYRESVLKFLLNCSGSGSILSHARKQDRKRKQCYLHQKFIYSPTELTLEEFDFLFDYTLLIDERAYKLYDSFMKIKQTRNEDPNSS